MTQKQFTKALVEEVNKMSDEEEFEYNSKDVEMFLEAMAETLYKNLKKDEPCPVRSIGRFKVNKRKARMGRNPQTGEALKIKASKKTKVTIDKGLRDRLGTK